MIKPNDWDKVQEFGEYTPLPAGAYVCKVVKAEETTSSNRKPMLKIALDIAEGEFAGYFRKQFDADTRAEKKWGCVVNQVLVDNNGSTARGFKTFITAVEKSNNTAAQWGDAFIPWLKQKKVGGLFRREEYLNAQGESKWAVKCFSFRSVDSVKDCPVPEDKPLNPLTNGVTSAYADTYSAPSAPVYNFSDFKPLANDDDAPF